MKGKIHYINTDLDLRSIEDLTGLATVLESRALSPLHMAQDEDGSWFALFETNDHFAEPEQTIAKMLDVIEALAPAQKAIWSRCTLKEFHIGYACGDDAEAFTQGLSSEVVGRIAAANASLRFTLYPNKPSD